MPVANLLNLPCTVVHVTLDGDTDELGDPTSIDTETLTVCYLEQRSTYDLTINRDTQIDEWLVALPVTVPIEGLDRVQSVSGYPDAVFGLFGPAWKVWNPTAQMFSHVECRTKRTR